MGFQSASIRSVRAVILLCVFFMPMVSCTHQAPLRITLVSDKRSYKPEEPIGMQIRLFNNTATTICKSQPVIVDRGFFSRDYHLLLTIIDPEGMPVSKKHAVIAKEPAPPHRAGNRLLVPVEIVAPDVESIYIMKDARRYYSFKDKFGWYTAYLRTSLRTYCKYITLPSGEVVADVNAKNGKVYNPLTSNRIRFEITP